jgi:hypothetical protein
LLQPHPNQVTGCGGGNQYQNFSEGYDFTRGGLREDVQNMSLDSSPAVTED